MHPAQPTYRTRIRPWHLLVLASLTAVGAWTPEANAIRPPGAALVQCTPLLASGTAAATTLTGLGVGCGSDTLTRGLMWVLLNGHVALRAEGVQPLNLYEVYWLPKGAGTVTSAVFVGNFATDASGNHIDDRLRTIATGADILTAAPNDLYAAAGARHTSGIFLVYSRGTYGYDSDGDGFADTYNTTTSANDPDASHTLANPALGSLTTGTQFISSRLITF